MKPSRRELLRGAALTGAVAGAGVIGACGRSEAPAQNAPVDGDVTWRTFAEAEKLQGLEFTSAERAMMLEEVEDRLQRLAVLRAIEMPNNLAPALTFDSKLPRKSIPAQKNILSLSPVQRPVPTSEDNLAFASVVELGAWIRAGAITSLQLTEIYLKRIAKYDGKLNAYITVTADLAREQAAKADADLRDGRDRGPLHGIPYALKDLADTKGIPTTWGATPF